MALADFFFDIGTGIAGGDLFIPAALVLISFFGLLIFTRFPKAAGLLVVGLVGYLFAVSLPIHNAFTVIYFGSLVMAGVLIALFFWVIFSINQ